MFTQMTVDVLIPTFNRSNFVYYQLCGLDGLRRRLEPLGIELRAVVSDNHSAIPVQVPEVMRSHCKVVRPDVHLPTAEENMFFGISKCESQYVWVLGDDDAPIPDSVVSILQFIAREKPALAVCNSSGSLINGVLIDSRTRCSKPEDILSLPDFISRTGFWFVISGISCLIFDREMAASRLGRFETYFTANKIYSHVFWLLEVFWESKFRFFNEPLVVYKQNAMDVVGGDHWESVAARENTYHLFPWVGGFIEHIRILRETRDIRPGFLTSVIDQSLAFRFHHLDRTPVVIPVTLRLVVHQVPSFLA